MPIPLYPQVVVENSLSPAHGGAEIDDNCQQIYEATKGWGANKQKVIDALATQDCTKRYYISIRYKELYNQDLYELMKKEFSGDFGRTMRYLASPIDKAECKMLHDAMKGVGSDINVLWSVLVGRTNEELDRMKKEYFKMYTEDLSKRLATELHGNMERLVFNSIQASEEVYDPVYHNKEKAIADSEMLYKQGQGRWGTNEQGIFKILFASPKEYMELLNKVYSDKYGYTLEKVMEKELGGNLQLAAIHFMNMKLKPYEAMAALIKSACVGFGTDEVLLTCTLIRYQHVMSDVMAAHIELYGKTIHDRIRSECGGKYKDLLIAIVNAAWPEFGE